MVTRCAASIAMAGLLLMSCGGDDSAGDDAATAPASTEHLDETAENEIGAVDQVDTSDDPIADGEAWDLVWFSDSMGWGVAEGWAERIEEAEGVVVRVHDHADGNQSIEQVRDRISGDAAIRQEVADAEIIVVYGNPSRTAPQDMTTCLATSGARRDPPQIHTSADFRAYGDVFRDIFDEIFELRSGQPTVIRAFDEFSGMLSGWREAGIEAECTAGWEASAEAIREAAAEYGVLTASFYDGFNGIEHDEDADEKGYIASDKRHASSEGKSAQVEIIHALGYDPIVP